MTRWTKNEGTGIAEMRIRLKDDLLAVPQYPEVVGDRRLLRFFRGNDRNVAKACKEYVRFLKWRKLNDVDSIRQEIVYGGRNSPFKFPYGEKVLRVFPQIIMTAKARDKLGQPLILEQYNFDPKNVLDAATLDEYALFFTYCMEFRTLILEQMSDEAERAYLTKHPRPGDRCDGYGVVMRHCMIRDLNGIGFAHVSSEARALFKKMMSIDQNYPDVMQKAFHVNATKVFTDIWYFLKGFLPAYSVAKINLCGVDFMPILRTHIDDASIPLAIGGDFTSFNEPFLFDISPRGPLATLSANQHVGPDAALVTEPPARICSTSFSTSDSGSTSSASSFSGSSPIEPSNSRDDEDQFQWTQCRDQHSMEIIEKRGLQRGYIASGPSLWL